MGIVGRPSPTVIGLEQEYGHWAFGNTELSEKVREAFFRAIFRFMDDQGRRGSYYLANGDRLYVDVGDHLEHATVEEGSVARAVARHFAADLYLNDAIRQFTELEPVKLWSYLTDAGLSYSQTDDAVRRIRSGEELFRLDRNNADGHGNTWGSHENYLVDRRMPVHELINALLPLRVAHHLLCGAGHMSFESNIAEGEYMTLSQRGRYTEVIAGTATTKDRAIFNLRDEPHAEESLYRRVHLTDGDANVSHTAKYLAVGMTNLIIKAIEMKMVPATLRFPHFEVDSSPEGEPLHPVSQLHAIDADPTLQTDLQLVLGPKHPIDVLAEYLDVAEDYVTKYDDTPENRDILQRWRSGIEGLRAYRDTGKSAQLRGTVDWLNKRTKSRAAIASKGIQPHRLRVGDRLADPVRKLMAQLKQFDIRYHAAGRAMKGVDQMFSRAFLREVFIADSTLGRGRVRALAALARNAKVNDWSHITVTRMYREGRTVTPMTRTLTFGDPEFPNEATFEEFRAAHADDDAAFIDALGCESQRHVQRIVRTMNGADPAPPNPPKTASARGVVLDGPTLTL